MAGEPAAEASQSRPPVRIVQERAARVLANEPAGAYRRLVLSAPRIADVATPGQFVACAVGEPDGSGALLLRRSFSLHRADSRAGTIEVVVADHAPGTHWIVTRQPGDVIVVLGPAGRGFRLPVGPDDGDGQPAAILVGGGYGSAPLFWLAGYLRARGLRADLVLGAATADRLFLPDGIPAREQPAGPTVDGDSVPPGELHLVTEDGSRGRTGLVTDVLGDVAAAQRAGARKTVMIYACGPMAMLRAVHGVAQSLGVTAQLAVEESMACGIGVCMTCVLPVVDETGLTRMTRSCVEGPVFAGDRLRWDAIDIVRGKASSRVPADCHGAPLPIGGGQ